MYSFRMNPQSFYGENAKAKQQTRLLPQPDISEEKVICIPTTKKNFINLMIHRVRLKIVKNMMRVKMKVQQLLFQVHIKVRKYVLYTR